MELDVAIKHILDENAIVIMGAGASYGAQNASGDFPSGKAIAEKLYEKCGITDMEDKFDLQDASQCYIENNSHESLIKEIKSLLTCVSFTEAHEIVFSLPWNRYYTTNYDNVALLACKKRGKDLFPVTISTDYERNKDKENLCVHINGHIDKLSVETLHTEFKLTNSSYLSNENIVTSPWGNLLRNDLLSAKCIVIIGLSLKYDLDLGRLLTGSLKEKIVIIDKPELTNNAKNQLQRYGTVYDIGIDAFAENIKRVSSTYIKHTIPAVDRIYNSFLHEYGKKYSNIRPSKDEVFQLFFNGEYSHNVFFENSDGFYEYFIYTSNLKKILDALLINKKQFVFIHADMGNGKTACVNALMHQLSKEKIHVFSLIDADHSKLTEEVSAICSVALEQKTVVIIENYTNHMEILEKFSVYDGRNIVYVFTARSATNINKMPEVFDIFHIKPNECAVFDINKLTYNDIKRCVKVFNKNGLFGRNAGKTDREKENQLSQEGRGNKRFQSILLEVMQSKQMEQKLEELIGTVNKESKEYYKTVLIILLNRIMGLSLSVADIEQISKVDIFTDGRFQTNAAIKELIDFDGSHKYRIKSPIVAKYLLQRISKAESVIDALCEIVTYCKQYQSVKKYKNTLVSVISYSHIQSFIKEFHDSDEFLLTYYDKLCDIDYYNNNHFFWLQYAIACIETGRYDRAERYLDTSEGMTPEGFIPFQINNQRARLYLEKIINEASSSPQEDFKKAHDFLMLPIVSSKDNEYNVVRLFGYYLKKKKILKYIEKDTYREACKDAYERVCKYVEKNTYYKSDLEHIKRNLLKEAFLE